MDVNPHVRPLAVPEQNSAQLIRKQRLVASAAFKYYRCFLGSHARLQGVERRSGVTPCAKVTLALAGVSEVSR